MKKIKKIVLWIAIVFLAFCTVMPIVCEFLNLEFASVSMKISYRIFLLFAVPLAVILTLLGTIKASDSKTYKIIKIIVTIMIAGLTAFMILISLFYMGSWINKQVLYEYKDDPDIKIIVREFDCGAVDNGEPLTDVYKVQRCTKYFIHSVEVGTAEIAEDEWIKVE